MEAFLNGAISALNKILKVIETLNQESKNDLLNELKQEINLYIQLYESYKNKQPIPNDLGFKLSKTNSEELKEDIEEAYREYDA